MDDTISSSEAMVPIHSLGLIGQNLHRPQVLYSYISIILWTKHIHPPFFTSTFLSHPIHHITSVPLQHGRTRPLLPLQIRRRGRCRCLRSPTINVRRQRRHPRRHLRPHLRCQRPDRQRRHSLSDPHLAASDHIRRQDEAQEYLDHDRQ